MVSYSSGGGDSNAAKFALAGVPFPVEMCNNATLGLSGGFIIGGRIRPIKTSCSKLGMILSVAGVTPNGANGMALYDSSGNLVDQTADMSTPWSTAGLNGTFVDSALSLGSAVLSTSADYYACVLSHMVTPPEIGGFFAGGGFAYPRILGRAPVIADGGHATFPSSLNLATVSTGNGGYWIVMEP